MTRIDWWRFLGFLACVASAAFVLLLGWALVPHLVRP